MKTRKSTQQLKLEELFRNKAILLWIILIWVILLDFFGLLKQLRINGMEL